MQKLFQQKGNSYKKIVKKNDKKLYLVWFVFKRKDFRAYTLGMVGLVPQNITWSSLLLGEQEISTNFDGSYTYTYAIERESDFTSYTGFYVDIELTFAQYSQVLTITTETNIIPEYDPAGDCHESGCFGHLV